MLCLYNCFISAYHFVLVDAIHGSGFVLSDNVTKSNKRLSLPLRLAAKSNFGKIQFLQRNIATHLLGIKCILSTYSQVIYVCIHVHVH
jgi:hypothetical protein